MKKRILFMMVLFLIVISSAIVNSSPNVISDKYSFIYNFSKIKTNVSKDFLVPNSITSITFIGDLNNQFEYYYPSTINLTTADISTSTTEKFTHNKTHLFVYNTSSTLDIIFINKKDGSNDGKISMSSFFGSIRTKFIYGSKDFIYFFNSTSISSYNGSVVKLNMTTGVAEDVWRINSSDYRVGNLRGFSKDNDGNFWMTYGSDQVVQKYNSSFDLQNTYVVGYFPEDLEVVEEEIFVTRLNAEGNITIYNLSFINIRNITDDNVAISLNSFLSYENNSLWAYQRRVTTGYVEIGGKPRDINIYVDTTKIYSNDGFFHQLI